MNTRTNSTVKTDVNIAVDTSTHIIPLLTREHTEKYWLGLTIQQRSWLLIEFNNSNKRNQFASNKADKIHKFLVDKYGDDIRIKLGLSV